MLQDSSWACAQVAGANTLAGFLLHNMLQTAAKTRSFAKLARLCATNLHSAGRFLQKQSSQPERKWTLDRTAECSLGAARRYVGQPP